MLNGSLYKNRFLDIVGSLNIDSFLVRQGLLSSSGVLQGYGSLSNFGFLFQFDSLYLFSYYSNKKAAIQVDTTAFIIFFL